MSKHEDKEISTLTACLLAFVVTASVLVMIVMIWPVYKTIPSKEQKPQVQKVKTEVLTHVIRCTTYVNDTCAEYKVYNVIRE